MPTTPFSVYVWILASLLINHRGALNPIPIACMPLIPNHGFQQYVKAYGNYNEEERRTSFSVVSTFPLSYSNSSLNRKRNIFCTILWCVILHCASRMGTVKGIYKGFKYTLSQFFVEKEPEMEIGCPTDVKHVAHIGWDGPSGNAPAWMNEFQTGPDFAASSIGNSGSALSPWTSQDSGESMLEQSELPPAKKKPRRKKCRSTSSPKSNSGSVSKSSRVAKSKTKFVEGNAKPMDIEVA